MYSYKVRQDAFFCSENNATLNNCFPLPSKEILSPEDTHPNNYPPPILFRAGEY